jgi:hypothetical protein
MTAKDAIRQALQTSRTILGMLLDNLSDSDILVRPVPSANTVAWQLGHLINSEYRMLGGIPGSAPPALPDGFTDRYSASSSRQDSTQGYLSKAEYLALYDQVRQATLSALDRIPESDLERPHTGPLAPIAPTVGALFQLIASHSVLHTGQFSVVRRALGKPNAF